MRGGAVEDSLERKFEGLEEQIYMDQTLVAWLHSEEFEMASRLAALKMRRSTSGNDSRLSLVGFGTACPPRSSEFLLTTAHSRANGTGLNFLGAMLESELLHKFTGLQSSPVLGECSSPMILMPSSSGFPKSQPQPGNPMRLSEPRPGSCDVRCIGAEVKILMNPCSPVY